MITTLKIAIDQIDVGDRRREDFGDLAGLAAGIKKVGQLAPILVDQNGDSGRYRLIYGERRLRAMKMLGRTEIRAQLCKHLSDDELRAIELEENDNRKALTEGERERSFESSKRIVEKGKQAEVILSESVKNSAPKRGRGRPPKAAVPQQAIADAIDVPRTTLDEAKQHVETATEIPVMQKPGWRQSHVLAVREQIEDLPPDHRIGINDVLECATILDPTDAVKLVGNMVAMKPAQREELFTLSRSTDPRERSLALTKAAKLPPEPDPRLNSLEAAMGSLRRASKPFPNDPLTPRIVAAIRELKKLHQAVKQISYDARRDAGSIQ